MPASPVEPRTVPVPGLAPLRAPVRVASVPHDQVYIRHCAPLPDQPRGFVRLPDPRPRRGDGTEQSGWWPPAMLEEGWIDEHHAEFDLMHIHFGFDALTPQDLHRVLRDLGRHRKPLVYTVHDLGNPHHSDPRAHRAALDVLIPGADALITLTRGAADEIRRTWGREAQVLPHPHVIELEELARRQALPRPRRGALRVGVHLKSLRPNMAARPVVDGLVAGAARLADEGIPLVVQVNTHPEVMDAHSPLDAGLAEHLRGLAARGLVDLRVHPYFDEGQLWDHLAALDASVLPYAWGTHSGWLEACVDLGTAVIAPDCGFYADQRPVLGYHLDRDGLDTSSLEAALRQLARLERPFRMGVAERREERSRIAAAHEELYRGLLT